MKMLTSVPPAAAKFSRRSSTVFRQVFLWQASKEDLIDV
jgi:hypothetical protein